GEHLLSFFHDPAGLLDLLGDRRAHLVEDVVVLVPVDANLVGQRDLLVVVHEIVEFVDEYEDVHVRDGTRGSGRGETRAWGTMGSTTFIRRGCGGAPGVSLGTARGSASPPSG